MTDRNRDTPAPRLDAYLTRKAQSRLDPTSAVYELPSGRWILERANQEPRDIGENYGRAKEALQLLIAAARAERRGPSTSYGESSS